MLRLLEKARPRAEARAGVAPQGATFGHAVLTRQTDNSHRLSLGSGSLPDQLKHAASTTVLPPHAYSLQLVEAPNVPADEMGEAVRWKIQHLIEFPVEEAIIETFELPPPANPGAKPMIYAVVARRSEIESHIEALEAENVRIKVIDIPELCLRNLAVRLPQDEYGVAFLHFNEDVGYLTITRGGTLYMLRRIELQQEDLTDQLQEIALQVQRSLDHYESQFGCPPIGELVVGPGDGLDVLARSLGDSLGIAVSGLDLSSLFAIDSDISIQAQRDCLTAIGAALGNDDDLARTAA